MNTGWGFPGRKDLRRPSWGAGGGVGWGGGWIAHAPVSMGSLYGIVPVGWVAARAVPTLRQSRKSFMPLKLRNISQLSGVSSVMFHRALQENSITWSHCGGGTAQLSPPKDTRPALAQNLWGVGRVCEALLTVLSSSFFWISFNMVCGERREAA